MIEKIIMVQAQLEWNADVQNMYVEEQIWLKH